MNSRATLMSNCMTITKGVCGCYREIERHTHTDKTLNAQVRIKTSLRLVN